MYIVINKLTMLYIDVHISPISMTNKSWIDFLSVCLSVSIEYFRYFTLINLPQIVWRPQFTIIILYPFHLSTEMVCIDIYISEKVS